MYTDIGAALVLQVDKHKSAVSIRGSLMRARWAGHQVATGSTTFIEVAPFVQTTRNGKSLLCCDSPMLAGSIEMLKARSGERPERDLADVAVFPRFLFPLSVCSRLAHLSSKRKLQRQLRVESRAITGSLRRVLKWRSPESCSLATRRWFTTLSIFAQPPVQASWSSRSAGARMFVWHDSSAPSITYHHHHLPSR